MYLPTPTSVSSIRTMDDYHIFTFGDEDSSAYVMTVFHNGEIRDSYVVAGGSYITLDFVRGVGAVA